MTGSSSKFRQTQGKWMQMVPGKDRKGIQKSQTLSKNAKTMFHPDNSYQVKLCYSIDQRLGLRYIEFVA